MQVNSLTSSRRADRLGLHKATAQQQSQLLPSHQKVAATLDCLSEHLEACPPKMQTSVETLSRPALFRAAP